MIVRHGPPPGFPQQHEQGQHEGEIRPRVFVQDFVRHVVDDFVDAKHIPVIICTTKDQETDKIWGLRQGAKDYVTKPLSESELLEKIKALG